MNRTRWWNRLFAPPRFILYRGYRLGVARFGLRLHDDGRVEWFDEGKWHDESTMMQAQRDYAKGCTWEPKLPVELKRIVWGSVKP